MHWCVIVAHGFPFMRRIIERADSFLWPDPVFYSSLIFLSIGRSVFTTMTGEVESPNYPSPYPESSSSGTTRSSWEEGSGSGGDYEERRLWCGTSWLRGPRPDSYLCVMGDQFSFPTHSERVLPEDTLSSFLSSFPFLSFSPSILFLLLSLCVTFFFLALLSSDSPFWFSSVCDRRSAFWSLLWEWLSWATWLIETQSRLWISSSKLMDHRTKKGWKFSSTWRSWVNLEAVLWLVGPKSPFLPKVKSKQ